ncbi:MAG TPA: hypothetical protein VGY97_07210 [Solirubrobacteraceae bacterium]|nr:hypothetical protein [Solirubrobacteraceae bacterium]
MVVLALPDLDWGERESLRPPARLDPYLNTCSNASYVGGNLEFHNNAAQGRISSNDIEGNLGCHSNTPPATGLASSNAVDGQSQGECASLSTSLEILDPQ